MHNKYLRERAHYRKMRDSRRRPGHPQYMESPEVEKNFRGYYMGEPAQYGYSHSNDYGRGRDYNDYARGRDYNDYNRGGRRDYNDYNDYGRSRDYNDYGYDYGYDSRDYNDGRRGRRRDYGYDYSEEDEEEKEYKEGLHHFIEKLKRQDKFNLSKEQVISHAKSMGVKFDKYDEEEFYATYLMMISDYKDMGNEPAFFVKMAKKFLEDEDSERQGSEKLCAYLYEVVMPSQK